MLFRGSLWREARGYRRGYTLPQPPFRGVPSDVAILAGRSPHFRLKSVAAGKRAGSGFKSSHGVGAGLAPQRLRSPEETRRLRLRREAARGELKTNSAKKTVLASGSGVEPCEMA